MRIISLFFGWESFKLIILKKWEINLKYYYLIGLGEMEIYETKKAKMPKFELSPGLSAKSIIKISCGGMHTLALCRDGIVFSWGNNDVGALGRTGDENTPFRVDG